MPKDNDFLMIIIRGILTSLNIIFKMFYSSSALNDVKIHNERSKKEPTLTLTAHLYLNGYASFSCPMFTVTGDQYEQGETSTELR